MITMDTKQVKELTGLTDNQITYLINKIDALKREKTQGKARDYSFRDLVYLKLASMMRSDGHRLPVINSAIEQVDNAWKNPENPQEAGVITIIPRINKKASRQVEEYFDDIYSVVKGWNNDGESYPELRPTLVLGSDSKWLIRDDDPEFSKYSNYLPGVIYSVSYIASELSKGDQLELDLMSEVGAVK